MRKGWNGNFEAGYGNDDHYRAKGMANRFKNKMNLSINGTANDNGINSNQKNRCQLFSEYSETQIWR